MSLKVLPIWMRTGENHVTHDLDAAKVDWAKIDHYLELLRVSKQITAGDSRERDDIKSELDQIGTDFDQRTIFGKTARAGGIKPLTPAETDAFLHRIASVRARMARFRTDALARYNEWLIPSTAIPP